MILIEAAPAEARAPLKAPSITARRGYLSFGSLTNTAEPVSDMERLAVAAIKEAHLSDCFHKGH